MKIVSVVGILAVVFSIVAVGVSMQFAPGSAKDLVGMRETKLRSMVAEMRSLETRGQLPGDDDYDKAAQQLRVITSELANANQILAHIEASRSTWRTMAVVAGIAGLALIGLALARRRGEPHGVADSV